MTDYKQLCRELVLLDQAEPSDYANWKYAWNAAIKRARAALTQPELEGPTDEELNKQWQELMGAPSAVLAQSMLDFARAVLARWGNSVPQPIPVSERLPRQAPHF